MPRPTNIALPPAPEGALSQAGLPIAQAIQVGDSLMSKAPKLHAMMSSTVFRSQQAGKQARPVFVYNSKPDSKKMVHRVGC